MSLGPLYVFLGEVSVQVLFKHFFKKVFIVQLHLSPFPPITLNNMEQFMDLRVILHRGHANLLCIVPILVYVLPKRALDLYFLNPQDRARG